MTALTKTKKTILLGVAALATLGVLTPFASAADSTQTDQTSNIEFNVSQVKEKLASQIGSGKVTEVSLKAKKSKDQNTTTNPVYKVEVIDGNTKKEIKLDATTGEVKETKEKQMSDNDKDKQLASENPSLSLEDAAKKALEKYPSGKIKEVELEKQDDKLVYDVKVLDGTTFHKLTIDANTGEITNDQTKDASEKKGKDGKHSNRDDRQKGDRQKDNG